jgi:hypothetical protein
MSNPVLKSSFETWIWNWSTGLAQHRDIMVLIHWKPLAVSAVTLKSDKIEEDEMGWALARMDKIGNLYILVRKPEGKKPI